MKVGQELWEGLMTLSGGREPRHLGEGASVLPLPHLSALCGQQQAESPRLLWPILKGVASFACIGTESCLML